MEEVPASRSSNLPGNSLSCSDTKEGKRKVSFSDEQAQERDPKEEREGGEAESRGGAGLRRLLYRHRQTISKMLHDGENHEVWRPGMRRPKRIDSQVQFFRSTMYLLISLSVCNKLLIFASLN